MSTTWPPRGLLRLGINVWRGEGIPDAPAPDTVAGLRHWIVLPSAKQVDAIRTRAIASGLPVDAEPDGFVVRDPAGIAALITTSN
jgi:hypothetical protein